MRFGATVRYRFEEVWSQQEVTAMCKGACGRKLKRVVKDCHTVNPFNKNEDGSVKTRGEVQQDVNKKVAAQVAKLQREGIYCKECAEELKEVKAP